MRNATRAEPIGRQSSPVCEDEGRLVDLTVHRGRYAGTVARRYERNPQWDVYLDSGKARRQQVDSHATVIHEDDAAEHIYEVISGQIMLYRLLGDGRRQIVDIIGGGDLFGMSTSGYYDCSAEAIGEAELRVLDPRDLARHPELQGHLAHYLMSQLEAMHSHAVLLGRKTAQERVASFLMQFVPGRGEIGCEGPGAPNDERLIVLRMTRQEIADYLGLTIETVSRVLSEMRRRGLIAIEKNDHIRLFSVCRICKLTGMHE